MEKFKFLEHTADAKFQAFGKNLEEAFSNAALAMFSVITNTRKVKENVSHDIECSSKDLKSLLYDFLEELVFLIDTENFLLNKVKYRTKFLKYSNMTTIFSDKLMHR